MRERRGRWMCRRLCEGAGWRRFEEKHGEAITPLALVTGVAVLVAAPHSLISLEVAIDRVTFAIKPPYETGRPAAPSRMLTGRSSTKAATTATATTISEGKRWTRTAKDPRATARRAYFSGAVAVDPCSGSSGSSSGVPVREGCLPNFTVCSHAAPAIEVPGVVMARAAAASAASADQSKLPVHSKAR